MPLDESRLLESIAKKSYNLVRRNFSNERKISIGKKHLRKAADKYEGNGNRRYMEIKFALPNELKTVEQYRQIIDFFIAKHLSDRYYAYAIHDKIGVMSDGQHHPHVHTMFSERMIDDVEKEKERAACNFFKYPARRKRKNWKLKMLSKFL